MEINHRHDVDWRVLCELASKELDPERLIELIKRLNEVLEAPRLRREQPNTFETNQEFA